MRDVTTTLILFSCLFVVLTTPVMGGIGGLSYETVQNLHHFISELLFWIVTLFICASGTYGAFVRQDRFSLSQNHPLLNRVLSVLLIASPFLAVFFNARFVFVMLGLLLFSHLRSRTPEEEAIVFSKSRAFSNMLILPLFTMAVMLMNSNGYYVGSLLDLGSTNTQIESIDENDGEDE